MHPDADIKRLLEDGRTVKAKEGVPGRDIRVGNGAGAGSKGFAVRPAKDWLLLFCVFSLYPEKVNPPTRLVEAQ